MPESTGDRGLVPGLDYPVVDIGDIDLDKEVIYLGGERLTEQRAEEIGLEIALKAEVESAGWRLESVTWDQPECLLCLRPGTHRFSEIGYADGWLCEVHKDDPLGREGTGGPSVTPGWDDYVNRTDEVRPIRTDGCPKFNLSADGPWNRCQRDRDHEGKHRDFFDREW